MMDWPYSPQRENEYSPTCNSLENFVHSYSLRQKNRCYVFDSVSWCQVSQLDNQMPHSFLVLMPTVNINKHNKHI